MKTKLNEQLIQSLVIGCKPVLNSDYRKDLYNIHENKKIGNYEIRKITIPRNTEQQFYTDKDGMCRCVFVDDYQSVQLREGKYNIWMSDTPMEFETNKKGIKLARGNVLECGLGIGLFTYFASKKKNVKMVTIVEKQKDVIALVYPVIKNNKTDVINSDVSKFLRDTKQKFDMIHIDIWADILPYKEFTPLVKLATKRLTKNGVIVCWLDALKEQVFNRLSKGIIESSGFAQYPPCMTCGKIYRTDYGGLCMDCADGLGISELFGGKKK